MSFPNTRLRRLRKNKGLRRLVAETRLSANDLVMPFFVVEGKNKKISIKSMPGIFQLSIDRLLLELKAKEYNGILLFGIPNKKDKKAKQAYSNNGIVQKAVRAVKKEFPDLVVITDVCLCSYTKDGHCEVENNDKTIEILGRVAVSHARAGADIVAPSAMMDGQVKAVRQALDGSGYNDTAIMAYSAKFASNFYGPFRDAADSAPQDGNRKSYQMDFRISDGAMREVAADIEEGADIVMVKPALAYLDIIYRVKEKFNIPVAAYNVSGEYSMIKKEAVLEVLTAIKRAGADIIITYHAKEFI